MYLIRLSALKRKYCSNRMTEKEKFTACNERHDIVASCAAGLKSIREMDGDGV
jgi:hypothetical protein